MNSDKVELTLILAKKPPILSKSFNLLEDNRLEKKPGGNLISGFAQTLAIPIRTFHAGLCELKPDQAFVFGLCGHKKALIVPQKKLQKAKAPEGLPIIARDREHFAYPSGPGILMLDYDPPPGHPPLSRDGLLKKLYHAWPALEDHPHIWGPSASSCVYRTEGNQELRGLIGQRVYIPILAGKDIQRAGDTLFNRLWLAGFGWFTVSKSGALLERSIIDASVWQPERLDFAGGAACGPGLEQRRPKPIIFNAEAQFIDTRKTMHDLTPEEENQVQALKDEGRKAKRPEVEVRRAEWIDERIAKALRNVPEEQRALKEPRLREMYTRAVEQKRLFGDFELISEKYGQVNVAEVLDNPAKFHNTRFSDPLEPDYNRDSRIAWANLYAAGKPFIFSHAHGGQKFILHRTLQTIRIEGGELPRIVEKVMECVRLDGALFDRGSEMVRMAEGKVYPTSLNWLICYLTGLARFEKFNQKTEEWKPVDCPQSVARAVIESGGEWSISKLAGIISVPIMAADGRVIETDGYDPSTGLYLEFPDSTKWPGIPDAPDEITVAEALSRVWFPFSKFPFVGPVDCGGTLAAILTAAIRPILPTAPGFYLGAPTPGSGKTLLAFCLAAVAGQNAEAIPRAADEDEMRKRLFAASRQGAKVLLFDNISGVMESDSLCAFLTSGEITDRVLGVSRMVTTPANSLCILTGNNVIFAGDLNRRLIRIEIYPRCERPHERLFDLNPLAHIRQNRLSIIRDILTVLRAAIQQSEQLSGSYGSFDEWSGLIRRAVVWIGSKGWLKVDDPLLSVSAGLDQDPEIKKLTALMCSWKNAFGKQGATIPEAIRSAKKMDDALFDVLDEIAGERGVINSRRLGRWIERHVKRIVDGCYFVSSGKRLNYNIWVVCDSEPKHEFHEFHEFPLTHTRENQKSSLYKGAAKHSSNSPNSSNSSNGDDTTTCASCVNFQENRSNPTFQGYCLGTLPDEDRSRFPDMEIDCPEFRKKASEVEQRYRQATTKEGLLQ